jgi:quinol-cytochrome oxidoreductase complex cytochrome b subunit
MGNIGRWLHERVDETMNASGRWFHERVPVTGDQLREWTNEPVPNHLKRWWFCLGGTPAFLFVVQIVTGILLAFYYQPSSSTRTNRSSTSPTK